MLVLLQLKKPNEVMLHNSYKSIHLASQILFTQSNCKWINVVTSNTDNRVQGFPLYLHRWMVNAPHCIELAWKFPSSTCRYRVLTVCDRSLLNNATLVPDAIHTANTQH